MKLATRLATVSLSPEKQNGFVAAPICRGSTAVYPSMSDLRSYAGNRLKTNGPKYGRFGSPTSEAFEEAMAILEDGFAAVAVESGLAAITVAIGAFVSSGDHVLISDAVYQPVRRYCESLKRFGVDVEFYDPLLGSKIGALVKSNTKIVYLESPASLTFEIQDVRSIQEVTHRHSYITTIIDNTWATPCNFKPLDFGVDVVVHSATKYISGHSDSLLGVIVCNEKSYENIRLESMRLGHCVSAEDASLSLRGLRTLAARLRTHESNASHLMDWLETHPAVVRVLHPSRANHPGHGIWKRDFKGGSGVFGLLLKDDISETQIDLFIDSLKYFSIGHSWGGFESLIVPSDLGARTRPQWLEKGTLLRLQIGLEDWLDLKDDLEASLMRFTGT